MTKGWQQAGLIFFVLISAAGAFAADESITITTYYPSPYGDYKSLSTTSFTYLATTEGNVGIGTTAPDSKLNIEDAAGSDTIGAGVLKISAATDANHEFSFRLDSANKNLNIDKRWGGSGATVLTIDRQFGNVGIGTGSAQPLGKLVVLGGNVGIGTSQPNELVTVRNLTGEGAGISLSQKAGGSLVALNFISKDEARHGKFDEGDLTTGDRGWGVGAQGDVPDWGALANDLAFFRYYPYPPEEESHWATLLTLDYDRPGVIAGYVSARDAPYTSTAQAALDVRGGVKIGYENPPACDAAHAGLVRYNGKWLEVCTDVTTYNNPQQWQWRPVNLPYYGCVEWKLTIHPTYTEKSLAMECSTTSSGTAYCSAAAGGLVLLGCQSVQGTTQYIANYLVSTESTSTGMLWTYRAYCVPVDTTSLPPIPDQPPKPCLDPPCYQPPCIVPPCYQPR